MMDVLNVGRGTISVVDAHENRGRLEFFRFRKEDVVPDGPFHSLCQLGQLPHVCVLARGFRCTEVHGCLTTRSDRCKRCKART